MDNKINRIVINYGIMYVVTFTAGICFFFTVSGYKSIFLVALCGVISYYIFFFIPLRLIHSSIANETANELINELKRFESKIDGLDKLIRKDSTFIEILLNEQTWIGIVLKYPPSVGDKICLSHYYDEKIYTAETLNQNIIESLKQNYIWTVKSIILYPQRNINDRFAFYEYTPDRFSDHIDYYIINFE